jgi:TolB-like protein/DNA-binding winged helix-turn-helix (wHTH) protein
MDRPATTLLRIGDWCVDPASGQISRDGQTARLETRALSLLLCLAEHQGQVVSIDTLLDHAWPGIAVSPDSVYQAVTSLRRVLGDDPKQPAYIATVPRLGYRMVASVSPWLAAPDAPTASPEPLQSTANEADTPPSVNKQSPTPQIRAGLLWAIAAAVCLALVAAWIFYGQITKVHAPTASAAAPFPQNSVAVLPFLDLTHKMTEEPFADGMTEELIDKLSKIPGLSVPSPTASFYFKNKQLPVAELAKALGVAYVIDGSVRRSGSRVRVAARLMRADNGYVVWSETYDRLFDDRLMIQDEIAGKAANALKASIEATPR